MCNCESMCRWHVREDENAGAMREFAEGKASAARRGRGNFRQEIDRGRVPPRLPYRKITKIVLGGFVVCTPPIGSVHSG